MAIFRMVMTIVFSSKAEYIRVETWQHAIKMFMRLK